MTNKKKKKLTKRAITISIVLTALAIGVSAAYVYGIDYYRKYYGCTEMAIDLKKYPVMGIDISAHQGKIDWQLVYDSKVSFAFIKATEGESFVDKSFERNWKEAKQKNIIVGAYLFFKFNKDGRTQAKNYIDNVKLSENDLPPVVDFEVGYGNKLRRYSVSQVQQQLLKCLRDIEKHYGVKPIIYTNVGAYNRYIKGSFDEYDLWLCKLCNEPNKDTKWTFWQYSHKGSVAGIRGNVDMNIYAGSYADFVNYLYNVHNKNKKTNAKTKIHPTNRRHPQNSSSKTT